MEAFYRFRVAFDDENEQGWVFSPQSSLEFMIPPTPELINEKLSLLRLIEKGEIDGVGKRKLKNVFYIILNEDEHRRLHEQLHEQLESANEKEDDEHAEAFESIGKRI
jgi:hypothetical protein